VDDFSKKKFGGGFQEAGEGLSEREANDVIALQAESLEHTLIGEEEGGYQKFKDRSQTTQRGHKEENGARVFLHLTGSCKERG